jgi:HK97 gp10 family phage protein
MPIKVSIDPSRGRAEIQGAASKLIRKITLDVEGTIKRSMAGSKSGKQYARGAALTKAGKPVKRRRYHRASAPGESPAVDTGNLINSIRSQFPTPLKGVLNIGAAYASFLEFGTRKMAARPYVRPAIKSVTDRLKEL